MEESKHFSSTPSPSSHSFTTGKAHFRGSRGGKESSLFSMDTMFASEEKGLTFAHRDPLVPEAGVEAGHTLLSLQTEAPTAGKGDSRPNDPIHWTHDLQVRIIAPDLGADNG